MPDVVVKHEVTEARVPLEEQPEQVLDLAFVPVGGMHQLADARYSIFGRGQMGKNVQPACVRAPVNR